MVLTEDQAIAQNTSLEQLVNDAKEQGYYIESTGHHPAVGKVYRMEKLNDDIPFGLSSHETNEHLEQS
jgi:hypothetical protein